MLQLRGRAQRNHLSAKDQRQPIAVFGLLHVVRGDKDGDALLRHLVNQVPELAARDGIDSGGGLVEKEDGRPVQHRAAQRQALLPSARKRAGNEILLALEIGHLKRPFDAFLKIFRRNAVEPGEESQVFDHLEIVVERELLRHVADVLAHGFRFTANIVSGNLCAAGGGLQQAAEHANGGGLAGAVRPEEAKDLAFSDFKIDVGRRPQNRRSA